MAWFLTFVSLTIAACFGVAWFINRFALKRSQKECEELRSVQPALQKQYEEKMEAGRSEILRFAKETELRAEATLTDARQRAEVIDAEAKTRAEAVDAEVKKKTEEVILFQETVIAMKNILDGYGDEYLVPTSTLLDDLAEEFSHKDAGNELKEARKHTKKLVKEGHAAECDYVEENRRVGAERFVIDAFNGKVDSILSKVKHDNSGKLSQAIHDAYVQVNFGGRAFRNARITDSYKQARLSELKWACVVHELKLEEREEQRRIREQIREEEKARREYQKAIKEAEKEERMLKAAMEKAQRLAAKATAEQRSEYESQLAELERKLHEAEEKNQRAVSMAQTTRRGHVYIISNVGSFGEGVYKIGLTRRLEPNDRVKELGDASVPFPFDVHAMIMSDDAPALERRLHNHFVVNQMNKVNHRKEFFKVSIADIRSELDEIGIEAKWTMASEAAEYRESLAIEKMIEEDPAAFQAWQNRQLTLDPTDYMDLDED